MSVIIPFVLSLVNLSSLYTCTVCDSSCLTTGQGGCATSPTDCCPFYNTDDSCTTSCDTNFAATPGTNYTCGEQKIKLGNFIMPQWVDPGGIWYILSMGIYMCV